MQVIHFQDFILLADCDTLKMYIRLCNLILQIRHFVNFLKLNNDILQFNKQAKKVTRCNSVNFETCKLVLIFPDYLCGQLYCYRQNLVKISTKEARLQMLVSAALS